MIIRHSHTTATLFVLCALLLAGCKGSQTPVDTPNDVDVFGLKMLYPSKNGMTPWSSAHWASNHYDINNRIDENDPLGISGHRGTGTTTVDNGELVMGGSQPRLYIYPLADQTPWQNIEVTVYYKRVEDADTDWAGAVIGIRSGEEGHAEEPCDAHTYYARLRQDGSADFAKELKHSDSAATASVNPAILWPETLDLPFHTWIGLKFVAYNDASNHVVLELYRDLTEGKNGGSWTLINSHTDDGQNWSALTDCLQHQPTAQNTSTQASLDGGSILIRNTDITSARYKWVSVREIQ